MSAKELVALLSGEEAGRVHCDPSGRLRFRYAEAWRRREDALHVSLSMPLANPEHGHAPIHAYLWGLLPDNDAVLERWGQRFHVSPRNAFGLLAHVGEECAGAVQLLRPERLADVQGDGPPDVVWLDESEVADRLRALREDQGAWRSPRDTGQFSLAGAQPKTALLCQAGRFGVPAGRTPTTHILKPPHRDRPGHVENEHVCLELARALGLHAAQSEVRRFGGELAIVVTRYDRVPTTAVAGSLADKARAEGGGEGQPGRATSRTARREVPTILRVHQEDTCQALGVHPTKKYQAEGGPTPRTIAELLRSHSSRAQADVAAFVDALVFNWLIAGTDGHAKNYSLLHASGGRVRLAPLYDLASALPYPDLDPRRLRLAMRIASSYRISEVARRHWAACAQEVGLDPEEVAVRARELAKQVPERLAEIEERVVKEGLDAPVVHRLVVLVTKHAGRCLKALDA